ncbi:hypothetical protein C8F01DRAFT_1368269 [Mycena amicta]|nr:hypothetical protein C8F01DRAFT_1368269 [Mycena amicta]
MPGSARRRSLSEGTTLSDGNGRRGEYDGTGSPCTVPTEHVEIWRLPSPPATTPTLRISIRSMTLIPSSPRPIPRPYTSRRSDSSTSVLNPAFPPHDVRSPYLMPALGWPADDANTSWSHAGGNILRRDLRAGPGLSFLSDFPPPMLPSERTPQDHAKALTHLAAPLPHSLQLPPILHSLSLPTTADAPRFSPQEIVDAAETPPNGSTPSAPSPTPYTISVHPRSPPPILPGCTPSARPASTDHSSFYPFCSSASCSVVRLHRPSTDLDLYPSTITTSARLTVRLRWVVDSEGRGGGRGCAAPRDRQAGGGNSLWDPSSDDDDCWTTIFIILRHYLSSSPHRRSTLGWSIQPSVSVSQYGPIDSITPPQNPGVERTWWSNG